MQRHMTQWGPFEDMLTLREAINQLLEDSVVQSAKPESRTDGRTGTFKLAVNISETPEAFLVDAPVPGIKAEDITISVENNVLTISGEIPMPEGSPNRTYHFIECRHGKFQRSMNLPNTVKVDAINASVDHGMLRLEIPKAEEVKPRRISVNVQGGNA